MQGTTFNRKFPVSCVALSLYFSLGSINVAAANEIRTFEYVGTVDQLCDSAEGCTGQEEHFSLNDQIAFQFSFDATTSDSSPSNPNIGRFTGSITAVTLTIGSHTFQLDPDASNEIFLVNDSGGYFDQFSVQAGLTGPNLFDAERIEVFLAITDPTGSMLADKALPVEVPFSLDGFRFLNLSHHFGIYSSPPVMNCPCSADFEPFRELDVGIDIKPGTFPNSINLGSGGATPVAILGSEDLDVHDIVPGTLTLGTAGIKTVGKTANYLCAVEDVSGDFSAGPEGAPDGNPDLVCHFETMMIAPEAGETQATLSGELDDETPIRGSDSVQIIP